MTDPILALGAPPGILYMLIVFGLLADAPPDEPLLDAAGYVVYACGPEGKWNVVRTPDGRSYHKFPSYGHKDGSGNDRYRWGRNYTRSVPGFEENFAATEVSKGLKLTTPILRHRAVASLASSHEDAGLPSLAYIKGASKDENVVVHHNKRARSPRDDRQAGLDPIIEQQHDDDHREEARGSLLTFPAPTAPALPNRPRLTLLSRAASTSLNKVIQFRRSLKKDDSPTRTRPHEPMEGATIPSDTHTSTVTREQDPRSPQGHKSTSLGGLLWRINNDQAISHTQRFTIAIGLLTWLAHLLASYHDRSYNQEAPRVSWRVSSTHACSRSLRELPISRAPPGQRE